MAEITVTPCDNLDAAIEQYQTELGFRLDMISPADAPREAALSKDGQTVRLISERFTPPNSEHRNANSPATCGDRSDKTLNISGNWVSGRAGMEYRDLLPDRMGGKVIASHIRLTNGGEVPDYVHYHKVDFQMIYCLKGRIKVVYEDQGPPFWLEPGDCVLQPPEIRHRVLECTAGSEVIEIGMPAVHETWVEHDIMLPTANLRPEKCFGGQRFVKNVAADSDWTRAAGGDCESVDLGIADATNGIAKVVVSRGLPGHTNKLGKSFTNRAEVLFLYVLDGNVTVRTQSGDEHDLRPSDSFLIPLGITYWISYSEDARLLNVSIPGRFDFPPPTA